MSKEDILYETKKILEWKLERESLDNKDSGFHTKFLQKLNPKRLFPLKDNDISEFKDSSVHWQFAVSDPDRTLLAILQDKFLEIRHKRDEYETPVARTIVPLDELPNWRKLSWSYDGILLAFSSSCGEIKCYDALLNPICSIPKVEDSNSNSLIPRGALVSLLLIEKRTRNTDWPYELLALEYNGNLRSYFISPSQGYKSYHSFCFCDTILTSATYVALFNMLVVAFPVSNLAQKSEDDTLGLSTWRLLNDYPYYRLVKPSIEDLHVSKTQTRWISFLTSNKKRTVIVAMSASSGAQLLACIHSCGSVTIWNLPQMTLHKICHPQDLPRYRVNEEGYSNECSPLDLNWCANKKLALIMQNGALTVSTTNNFDNILGQINAKCHSVDRQPELVNTPAKLANICDIRSGFLVLDCRIKTCSARRDSEFSQNQLDDESVPKALEVADHHSLWRQILKFFVYFEFFHQQKKVYIEKTYSVTFLKQITPEELYSKKINAGEYAEALEFARLFELDENRVYKKQWERNPATTESIEKYLAKVSNKWWIMNECCQRIPDNLSAARTLLKYGLQLTDFDVFVDYHDVAEPDENDVHINFDEVKTYAINLDHDDNFSPSQLLLFQIRKYLLFCLDILIVYEKIIELNPTTSYSEDMYRKFRANSVLQLALYYSRDCKVEAVEVLLTYYGNELLPFWLKILDDIPECISPSSFKQLLPKINEYQKLETWKCKRIREADWSESGNFKSLVLSKPNKQVDTDLSYPFTYEVVASWYENKIRKVVEQSGLVDNALELLNLARLNGIKSLDYLQHNLLVLDTVMYELVIEKEVTLVQIETYSEIDKLILLMSKSNCEETFLEDLSNILLPFLNRCESLYPNSRDTILDEYFQRLSENDLSLPLIFFSYLAENDEVDIMFSDKRKLEIALLSVYSCKRVDQINLADRIVRSLPHVGVSDNNNIDYEELFVLNSRVNELQYELEILQKLNSYGIEKDVQTLHQNKNNMEFQKNTLSDMVTSKLNRTSSRGIQKKDMYDLLDDMEYVQQFFVSLPDQAYLRIFAYTMLTASRNDCIEDYAPLVLTCSISYRFKVPGHRIAYEESVGIIVEAAQYYYNIASSYDDICIDFAKSCLSLVDFHPEIEREKKLINALQELNNFGVYLPPLKIRMSVDKIRIIEKVLNYKPTAYKKIDKLISLANNLDVDQNHEKSLEYEVLSCAIDGAFQLKDFLWCSKIVSRLIESNYPCWEVCKKLCESEDYDDLETKQNLIKIAIMQCSDKELSILVELRNEIERKILRNKLQSSFQQLQGDKTEDNQQENEERAKNDITENTIDNLHNLISISSLTNILQTSSANVLNVDFWKNTFRFRPDCERDDAEPKRSTNFNQLSYPDFYKSLHEHTGCACSPGHTTIDNEKHILQLLLHYNLLTNKNHDDNDLSTVNINDVIAQLAVTLYPNDCVSSLCLMLLLNDETYSEKVLDSFPPTDSVEKFALYYYCLKVASTCGEQLENVNLTESPSMLISKVLSLKECNSKLMKLVKKYYANLEKRRGISKLRDLGCGIDSVRFFNDDEYRIDSILGVAMYEEKDKLDLALSLGDEYGVSNEDVVLSHITSLFLSRNISLLTERLKEPKVLEILKKKSSYVAKRIVSDIYEGIYGCDYQVLLLYYALLNQVAENEIIHHLKAKDHMKVLRKLKSFSKTIDYKLLMSEPPKLVEALMPALFNNETSQVANLLFSLPNEIKKRVDFANVLEQISEKIFFNGPADLTYVQRFGLCHPFLEKISEDRINNVMQKFFFSKRSCEVIETDERKKLLNIAINFFSAKLESFSSVVEYLKNYSKQYKKIDELNELCRAVDINETYLKDLQTAFIENDDVKRIILKMVLDMSISVDVIKVILEFARMDSLTDIITELLNNELNKNTVESLVHRIENCLEDNEYEKCWSAPLKWFLNDEKISDIVRNKIKNILSILDQSEDEIYKTIELLHETRLILREWDSVHSLITLFDISTESARLKLICELFKKANSFVEIKNLHKLLLFWPAFHDTNDLKNDPWMLLLEKILQLDEINDTKEMKIMEKIINKRKPTKEAMRSFFERITGLPHNDVLLVWFCILTKDDLLIQSVNGYVMELRETGRMPKIIETYLRQLQL